MGDSNPAKTWDFTLCNYTPEDIVTVTRWSSETTRMVVSKEVCPETGTPHLQGRMTFRRAYRHSALKKQHGRCNWTITRRYEDFIYPMKDGSEVIINVDNRRKKVIKAPIGANAKTIAREDFKPWQADLANILEADVTPGVINWYWEPTGGAGKTAFIRWAIASKELGTAVLVGGRAQDMKFAVSTMKEKGDEPRVVFVNIAKGGTCSYTGLEALKDGLWFSSKYESGMCMLDDEPHVVVFSNEEPDYERWTKRRYNVVRIDEIDAPAGGAGADFKMCDSTDDVIHSLTD